MVAIREIAKACKSKNAGPFEVTIDVVFDDRDLFERVPSDGGTQLWVIRAALQAAARPGPIHGISCGLRIQGNFAPPDFLR